MAPSQRFRTVLTELVFVIVSITIALLALFSPALIPKNPISYLTSDYLTYYSVIQNRSLFSDTLLLSVSADTARNSFLVSHLLKFDLPPVYLFLMSYLIQNFLFAYGLLKLAHALRPGITFAVAAVCLTIVLTDGIFFSIRTHLSFLSLGVVFVALGYLVRGNYVKTGIAATVTGLIHPTQALVFALLAIGDPRVDLRKKLTCIVLPVAVLTVLVAVGSFDQLTATAPGFMVDQKALISQFNDNFYPMAHPVLWLQLFLSLALAAAVFHRKHQLEPNSRYAMLAGVFAVGALLQFSTLILDSGLRLPSLAFQVGINFRLMQLAVAVLFVGVAVMIYDGLSNTGSRWLYFALGLLITLIFPHIVKSESPASHLVFMQDTSFKYNMILLALAVGLSQLYSQRLSFAGSVLSVAALGFGGVLYYNQDSRLFIPLLILLLAQAANLKIKDYRIPSYIASRPVLTVAILAVFGLSLYELHWNIEYSRTFFTGERTLKTTVVKTDWTGGPILVAPLREIELSPIYPVLIERLDTSYIVYLPHLRDRMLDILDLYKSRDDESYESTLKNATGWRMHIDELQQKYPSVKYVVTFEKHVCGGDKNVTPLWDRRMRKLALIPIETADRTCGRST